MNYQDLLKKRAKESKVYAPYQLTGLMLAEILEDKKHKSLYIKLAKNYEESKLIRLAKSIAEKKNIKNKGAYFMKVWHNEVKGRKPQVKN
jgi:hypothetical protein